VRVVLDTNVVVSALIWGGTPERLIELAGDGVLDLFTTEALLAELAGILGRSKFAQKLEQKNLSAAEIVAGYRELAATVEPASIEVATLRDPDDQAVIACAIAARAEFIVSGDRDLLALKAHGSIRIVNAAEAVGIVTKP
jgi:uncharacterized protein